MFMAGRAVSRDFIPSQPNFNSFAAHSCLSVVKN
jgi:hypothetical protein